VLGETLKPRNEEDRGGKAGEGEGAAEEGGLILSEVCQFFCVNGPVLFLGMGARGKGQRPFPRPAM